jgi:hypothetical protein
MMKAERRRYVRQLQGWLWGKLKTKTPAIDLFHFPRAVMSNEQKDLRYRLILEYHSQGIYPAHNAMLSLATYRHHT